MKFKTGIILGLLFIASCIIVFSSGCAQIGVPTGGPKDTLAPVLVKATPLENSRNVAPRTITLSFNEYIEITEIQKNLLVSPLQKVNPTITYNLRTITIKFRDSLIPNTTYTINFGNAIKDVNEGNLYKNYNYVFSTGSTIDSLTFDGKVLMAETGLVDSTLIVLLYRNLTDTAVRKLKPDYITRLNGNGTFRFDHLASGTYKAYALLDTDGGKFYNSRSEVFGFLDTSIVVSGSTPSATFYASAEVKDAAPGSSTSTTTPRRNQPATNGTRTPRLAADKKLRYGNNLTQGQQDLLGDLVLTFNHGLQKFDSQRIVLADTNYNVIANTQLTLDSTRQNATLKYTWPAETNYVLIVPKDAVSDSFQVELTKSDTIRFKTKRTEDYARVTFRFNNINLSLNPVLQFVQANKVISSYPITGNQWSNTRFPPGEYDIRILYDSNKNGVWDPGNFAARLQPEKAFTLPQKIAVKADWDNERDISF